MTPRRYQKLDQFFQQVMDAPSGERGALARELCNDDPILLSELLALVHSAEAESTSPIDVPFIRLADGNLPAFAPGEILFDRFRIIRFLGRGGMGEVYEADDPETGRVALKTIRPEIAQHPNALARFRQEVQLARKVSGPSVCRIHEILSVAATPGRPALVFLTMEFLPGTTLADRLNAGPLPMAEAEKIALQICRGLQTIHEAGIIHRDLKGRNIMLAERRQGSEAVLMDFGLAREFEATAAAAGSAVTTPGAVAGTLPNMAPEQFSGGTLSPATDIYALGIILYELVTGRHPFESSIPLAAAVERGKRLDPVSTIRRGVPSHWDRTIARCLRYKPEERFQTAREVELALTSPASWPARATTYVNRHRVAGVFATLLFSALISAALIFWLPFRGGPYNGSPKATYWFDQGTAAVRDGTYLKASNALQMAVKLDPNFVLAHARLADAWNELDFETKAKDEMLLALNLASHASLSATDRTYLEAVQHTIMREFPQASQDYQVIFGALSRDRKADGYVDLGRAYEKTDSIDQAIAAYSAAAQLNPQDPAPFRRLGILKSRRKQSAEADASFAAAERLYSAASNLEGIAEVDFQRGNDANTQMHLAAARTYLQKSLQVAKTINSPQLEIRALTRLSVTEYLAGNADLSSQLANQAIASAQENGLGYWFIDGTIRLGNAYYSKADYTKAESCLERALSLAKLDRHPRLVALAQFTLASVRGQLNKPRDEIALATAAYDYYRSGGFASESASALTDIVRAQRDMGDNVAALKSAQELMVFAVKLHQPADIMHAEESLGTVLLDLERYPEALVHFEKALAASRAVNSSIEFQLLHRADVLWRLGGYEDASHAFAEVPVDKRSRPQIAIIINEHQAEMLISQKRFAAAKAIAQRALADKANGDPGFFERILGQVETSSGRSMKAIEWCQKALAQAKTEADDSRVAAANLALANAYLAANSASQAMPFAHAAFESFANSQKVESEYFSLLTLASAARATGDLPGSRNFAKKGLDLLGGLANNYSTEQYQSYTSRPDVRGIRARLSQLGR